MTVMMKSLELPEALASASLLSIPRMLLLLVFLSQHLISVLAETMHGAKGCERSMVWTRANSPTIHPILQDISKMGRLPLKKGTVAPYCRKSFATLSKLMVFFEQAMSAWAVWLHRVVQSGVDYG